MKGTAGKIKFWWGMITGLGAVRAGKKIPLYCEWEITSRCNMRCAFCSTRADSAAPDIGTEAVFSRIDELKAAGTKIVHFSGGEPTLRRDLPEILKKARHCGMMTSVTTNGSCDRDFVRGLLPADLISVSLDGPPDFHDRSRNFPGAYEKAVAVVRTLQEFGKHPLISAVYKEDTTLEILEDLIGRVGKLGLRLLITVCARNLNDFTVLPDREYDTIHTLFERYRRDIVFLRKKYPGVVTNPQPYLTVVESGGLDRFGCRAMDIAVSIKSDGTLSFPCNGLILQRLGDPVGPAYVGETARQMRLIQGRHAGCRFCAIRCMASASALLRLRGMFAVFDAYVKSL